MSRAYGSIRVRHDLSCVPSDLVTANEKLIWHLARKLIAPNSAYWDDVLQVGRIGLAKAIASHPQLPRHNLTWAIAWITGAMRDFLRDGTHTIRYPQTYWRLKRQEDVDANIVSLDEYSDDDREFGLGVMCIDASQVECKCLMESLDEPHRSVVALLVAGLSAGEIAVQLSLTSRSVADRLIRHTRMAVCAKLEEAVRR